MNAPSAAEAQGPHGPVPLRVYEPETVARALLWVHGGSFIGGDLDMPEADWVARRLSESASALVVTVDYRLAGGDIRFPVPGDDVRAAWEWMRTELDRRGLGIALSLGGASAGANLATGVALGLDDRERPAALLLAYPTLHARQRGSHASVTDAGWPAHAIEGMYRDYLGSDPEGAPDTAVPGTASADRLAVLPPTTIIASEDDGLRASAEEFAQQLEDAGVPVFFRIEPGTPHGHLNDPGHPGAEPSIATFAGAIIAADRGVRA